MKKQLLNRGLFGIPTGIAIGYLITVICSAIWGRGYYSPCAPALVQTMGSEIAAVVVQTILCAIVGSGFAMASLIWELEHWSMAKQSGVYFLLISAIMLPVAYLANWMEHSILGFFLYFAIFSALWIVLWGAFYLNWRWNIKKINAKLNQDSKH